MWIFGDINICWIYNYDIIFFVYSMFFGKKLLILLIYKNIDIVKMV